MRCRRCGGAVLRSWDEAACLMCGHQVVVAVRASDVGGDSCVADIERHGLPERQRPRGPSAAGSSARARTGREVQDGCVEAPSCLACPLPECVYKERRPRVPQTADREPITGGAA